MHITAPFDHAGGLQQIAVSVGVQFGGSKNRARWCQYVTVGQGCLAVGGLTLVDAALQSLVSRAQPSLQGPRVRVEGEALAPLDAS